MSTTSNDKTICKALINNKVVEYDLCSINKTMFGTIGNKEYLGTGTIYSIGGVKTSEARTYHFWRMK